MLILYRILLVFSLTLVLLFTCTKPKATPTIRSILKHIQYTLILFLIMHILLVIPNSQKFSSGDFRLFHHLFSMEKILSVNFLLFVNDYIEDMMTTGENLFC